MATHDDLFTARGAEFSPQPDRLELVAGKVVARLNKPCVLQKRFNSLMERIDLEQSLAATLRHALGTLGRAHLRALRAAHVARQGLLGRMLTVLDQRVQATGKPQALTASQKQQAIRIILRWSEALTPTQELGLEAAQRQQQAQVDKRAAKRAARKAQQAAVAPSEAATPPGFDAQNALRTVFRQLASALHPDREPNAQQRMRKTELMSEVNAAYGRKDLNALLRIQLQADMADVVKTTALSEAKLKAMCELLAEQAKALETDNRQWRQRMEFEFGYAARRPFDTAELLAALQLQRAAAQDELDAMQDDLQRLQDPSAFKVWLKEQNRLAKAEERLADAFERYDLMRGMMRP